MKIISNKPRLRLVDWCTKILCPNHKQPIDSIDVTQGAQDNQRILCFHCQQYGNKIIRIQKVEQDLQNWQKKLDTVIEKEEEVVIKVIKTLELLMKQIEQYLQQQKAYLDKLTKEIFDKANKLYSEAPLIEVIMPFSTLEQPNRSDIINLANFLASQKYEGQNEEYMIGEGFSQFCSELQELKLFDTLGQQINIIWEGKCEEPFQVLKTKYQLKDVHWKIQCENCKIVPITGTRYLCNKCPYFNLCENCYNQKLTHQKDHQFIPLESMKKERVYNEIRIQQQTAIHYNYRCAQCQQFPIMGLKYICEVCPKFYYCKRCYKKQNEHTKKHKFVAIENEEENEKYLETLQKICSVNDIHPITCKGCNSKSFIGIRFRCEVCNDFDCCQTCYDKHNKDHNFIHLSHFCQGITCDGCGQQQVIGISYKCNTCPNYNFCHFCFKNRSHNHHFHTAQNQQYGQIQL